MYNSAMNRFVHRSSVLLLVVLSISSCSSERHPVFDFLGREYVPIISRMMDEDDYSSRFVIIHDLLKQVLSQEGSDALRSLVHQYTLTTPEDPFNSYYLLLVAEHYRDIDAEMSEYFYNQILTNYADVIVEDRSTHFLALENLLLQVTDPSLRVLYYTRLLSDFEEFIDPGLIWYRLAQEYRKNGQFEEYFEALGEFQNYPDTIVQGRSNIHQLVEKELDFHFNSRKDWTHPNLTTLVESIKEASCSSSPRYLSVTVRRKPSLP